jgi:hypothetical protein
VTALGMLLVAGGVVMVYAGLTGQHILDDLRRILAGGGK